MKDVLNNTTPAEAAVIFTIFIAGFVRMRKKPLSYRRTALFVYGLVLILYITLLRRIPGVWDRTINTARLELIGFNFSGCILNALLFIPLGLSLRIQNCWFPILLSVVIESVQQIANLGMFDMWDILFNGIGGMTGIAVRAVFDLNKYKALKKREL